MSKLSRNALIALILLMGLAGYTAGSNLDATPVALPVSLSNMTLIAHAGGGIAQGKYSNTIEAFRSSAKRGYELIETDFSWTKNGQLVLLHDWDKSFKHYYRPRPLMSRLLPAFFERPSKNPYQYQAETSEQFMAIKMNQGLQQMDLQALFNWMRAHPNNKIVTDLKEKNIEALVKIAELARDLKSRFIPQIYAPDEYAKAKALGFAQIIFTAYRSDLSDAELVQFLGKNKLFALTIPAKRVSKKLVTAASKHNTPVFTHTLNTKKRAAQMASMGVTGLYTDYLVPGKN